MDNGKSKAVQITTLKVEVSYVKKNDEINFNKKQFVEVSRKKGILATYNLIELKERLNTHKRKKGAKKKDNPAILKGIYKKWISGKYCEKPAPFVFFDIDVKNDEKKKENLALFDKVQNNKVFKELEQIAVLVWRSDSGLGIAGALYVPQITEFDNDSRQKHKKVAESIFLKLSEYLFEKTNISIEFDNAQGKFRQERYLADQRGEIRHLNRNPLQFDYKCIETPLKTSSGVQKYHFKGLYNPSGSIPQQFNENNRIEDVLQNFGYQILDNNRVKSPLTSSPNSGFIKDNVLFNYSSTSGAKEVYTPYSFILEHKYSYSNKAFLDDLKAEGYKDIKPKKEAVKTAETKLKDAIQETDKIKDIDKLIFEYCFNLKTLNVEDKKALLNRLNPKPELKKYFIEYLGLTKQTEIIFDQYHEIKRFVSEKFETILQQADQKNNVLVYAETGTGKTTAIFKEFKRLRPESRCLILAPLTIIVNQLDKDHQNEAIFLTGESNLIQHKEALKSQIVVATYEQGAKHLTENYFDYIFIDEFHQFITANSYKSETINDLTQKLQGKKIIGLTGTPQQIFKNLGYTFLSLTRSDQKRTKLKLRYWNAQPYQIIINHLRNVKGKVLFKLDEKNTIDLIKAELIEKGNYKENEILVLKSTRKIKNSKDFKDLANERKFDDSIKIVLTTSLINEGLSIEQKDFSDIVYIENSFNPRPEPIKQFFARFRNDDENRVNYLYLKHRNDPKPPSKFNIELNYKSKFDLLSDEVTKVSYNEIISTYNDLTDPRKFLYSNGTINTYYLAYNVTEGFFCSINENQFVDFLETNYNLSIKIDDDFRGVKFDPTAHNEAKKQLKRNIAKIIKNNFDEVLDVVATNTQSKKIKEKIRVRNIEVEPSIYKLITDQIKDFEDLILNYFKFQSFGLDDPKHLLKNGTLKSRKEVKDELFSLKLQKLIKEPKTATDKKNSALLITFVLRMKQKQVFTYSQMMTELKKLRVLNFNSYKKSTCIALFEYFKLIVEDDKRGLIKLKQIS